MELGKKLFEEAGKITAFRVTKVHPIEGVTIEVTFRSEIRGSQVDRVLFILVTKSAYVFH